MDDKEINPTPKIVENSKIVETLSNLLKDFALFFSQDTKVISGLVILMTLCSVLILSFSNCSWSTFLIVMTAILLATFIVLFMAYYFEQRRGHNAQIINACKEIEKSLGNLINPKVSGSTKDIFPVVVEIFRQVSKCIKTQKQQDEVKKKLDRLLNGLSQIIDESRDVVERIDNWLEAGNWLEKYRNELIDKAVDMVSEK